MTDMFRSKLNSILFEQERPEHDGGANSQPGYYIYFADKPEGQDIRGPFSSMSEAMKQTLDIGSDGKPMPSAVRQIEHLAVLLFDEEWYVQIGPKSASRGYASLDDAKARGDRLVEEMRGTISREQYMELIIRFLETEGKTYDDGMAGGNTHTVDTDDEDFNIADALGESVPGTMKRRREREAGNKPGPISKEEQDEEEFNA